MPPGGRRGLHVVVQRHRRRRRRRRPDTPDPGASEQVGALLSPLSGVGDDATVAVAPRTCSSRAPIDDAGWRDEVGFGVIDLSGDVASGQPPDDLQRSSATSTGRGGAGGHDRPSMGAASSMRSSTVTPPYYSWGDDWRRRRLSVSTVPASAVRPALRRRRRQRGLLGQPAPATMEPRSTPSPATPVARRRPELGPMACAGRARVPTTILTADGGAFQTGAGAGGNGRRPSLEPPTKGSPPAPPWSTAGRDYSSCSSTPTRPRRGITPTSSPRSWPRVVGGEQPPWSGTRWARARSPSMAPW